MYQILPPFPCCIKQATALLEQWVKDSGILFSHLDHLPSQADYMDADCLFRRKKGHNLEHCVS